MKIALAVATIVFAVTPIARAATVSIAGFDFPNGEDDFAQSAVVVAGGVTGSTLGVYLQPAEVQTILAGSNISDSMRVIAPDVAEIEIAFGGRQILNAPGPDAVVFELSGDMPVGTPEPRERFELSVSTGGSFTAYHEVIPIATGYPDPPDGTLDIFAVLVDLSDFGLAPGTTVDAIRLRLVDHLETRSADPTAIGLLHSVPESDSLALIALMVAVLALRRDLELDHRRE